MRCKRQRIIKAKADISNVIYAYQDTPITSMEQLIAAVKGLHDMRAILHVLSLGEYIDEGGFRFPLTSTCCRARMYKKHYELRDKHITRQFDGGLYTPGDTVYIVSRNGEIINTIQFEDVCISRKGGYHEDSEG